jgi:hypothetical protein
VTAAAAAQGAARGRAQQHTVAGTGPAGLLPLLLLLLLLLLVLVLLVVVHLHTHVLRVWLEALSASAAAAVAAGSSVLRMWQQLQVRPASMSHWVLLLPAPAA